MMRCNICILAYAERRIDGAARRRPGQNRSETMRSIAHYVLPAIVAASVSGLTFAATLI
jgi:hypothetical protein